MLLHFQEKPWDLIVTLAFSVVMAAVLLALNVGSLLAILLVLFVPGYVLVAALFPGSFTSGKSQLDWMERIALSFGLSVAVVPLLGLLLNFTPFGLHFAPLVTTMTLFTVSVGYGAYLRRMRLPPGQRLSLTVDLGLPEWDEYSFADKGLTVALAAGIVVAGGTLAYVVLSPRPGETFTQFYILGPGGKASDYPTVLNVSQTAMVILGIANHESTSLDYALRIDLLGVRVIYNSTSGFNETVEVNRTTWSAINVSLMDGASWTYNYTFSITFGGLWKVQFLLFRAGDLALPYRELHLFIRVT